MIGFGVTGADGEARRLRELLGAGGVEGSGLVEDASRPTTVKRSLIGLAQHRHPQKMFRVDFESRDPIPGDVLSRLLDQFDRALPGADVVCIEDYDKGVCSASLCRAVMERCRKARKPVFVDPARLSDYAKYKGATAITPNRTEAETATGLPTNGQDAAHNTRLATKLLSDLDLDAVVLTLDKHGALLLERAGKPLTVTTVAREVYDVTGAGDMFLAALAAARAHAIPWPDAVRFANAAAGLEVEIFGVEPIPLERIHHELLIRSTGAAGKLRTLEQALVQAEACRRERGRVVFTNGCFDILHSGHVTLLEKAAAEGDLLIVGLNTDDSVRRLKGDGRPVNNELDRARVLGALGCVGAIVLFGEDTPMRLIEAIRPDVLAKGADYSKDRVVGGAFVEKHGGRVALIDLVEGKSTSGTIARVRGHPHPSAEVSERGAAEAGTEGAASPVPSTRPRLSRASKPAGR